MENNFMFKIEKMGSLGIYFYEKKSQIISAFSGFCY